MYSVPSSRYRGGAGARRGDRTSPRLACRSGGLPPRCHRRAQPAHHSSTSATRAGSKRGANPQEIHNPPTGFRARSGLPCATESRIVCVSGRSLSRPQRHLPYTRAEALPAAPGARRRPAQPRRRRVPRVGPTDLAGYVFSSSTTSKSASTGRSGPAPVGPSPPAAPSAPVGRPPPDGPPAAPAAPPVAAPAAAS